MLLDVILFVRLLFEESHWHRSSFQYTWEVHSEIRFVAAIICSLPESSCLFFVLLAKSEFLNDFSHELCSRI